MFMERVCSCPVMTYAEWNCSGVTTAFGLHFILTIKVSVFTERSSQTSLLVIRQNHLQLDGKIVFVGYWIYYYDKYHFYIFGDTADTQMAVPGIT